MKLIISLLIISFLAMGCKNNPNLKKDQFVAELTKAETTDETDKPAIALPEYYTPPPGIESDPFIRRADSFTRLNMQEVLKNERTVKLSDFGKELSYHRITEPIMRIREILSIPDGYLVAAFTGSVYLYDRNFKMVKKVIEEDIDMMEGFDSPMIKINHAISGWCYDTHSGLLFCLIHKWLTEKGEYYTGTIPVSELIGLSQPITPDGLKNKIKAPGKANLLPLRNGYAAVRWFTNTMYTFNVQGDTMSILDPIPNIPIPYGTLRISESPTVYVHKNNSYFRFAYSEIVFQLTDYNTFSSVYQISFGDKQVTPAEGPDTRISLADKYMLNDWKETDDYIFIRFTQDYDSPNNRKSGSVKFYQAVYNKQKKEFYSFNSHKKLSEPYNIPNDIDNGIDFWPDEMIDDKPYMTLNGKKYKELLRNKLNHRPVYPDITDNEIVLITIN